MNKSIDKFCPDCGHHVFEWSMSREVMGKTLKPKTTYYCAECKRMVDEPATLKQVQELRDQSG